MRYESKIFLMITLFFFTQAQALTKTLCRPADNQKIEQAVKTYLEQNNTISYQEVVILSKRCDHQFARATLHPKKPVTDDATLYLQKVKGRWQVIRYGTDFDPAFLARMPKNLRN